MAISKEFKTRWVCALRSGLLKQNFGGLQGDKDGEQTYCVLGVGAAVLEEDIDYQPLTDNGVTKKVQKQLIEFNDTERWSFEKLARWIQRNVPTK